LKIDIFVLFGNIIFLEFYIKILIFGN